MPGLLNHCHQHTTRLGAGLSVLRDRTKYKTEVAGLWSLIFPAATGQRGQSVGSKSTLSTPRPGFEFSCRLYVKRATGLRVDVLRVPNASAPPAPGFELEQI